jgi:hypothetical protein
MLGIYFKSLLVMRARGMEVVREVLRFFRFTAPVCM